MPIAAERRRAARYYAQSDGTRDGGAGPGQAACPVTDVVPISLEGQVLGTAQVMSHHWTLTRRTICGCWKPC